MQFEKMNNYQKAVDFILETFSAKKVKEFRGHDGYGYNADIYLVGKKIAEVDNDGWGGGLRIHYISEDYEKRAKSLINDLPKCLFSEAIGGSSDHEMIWDDELVFDHVATDVLRKKDFKKQMKKITFIQDNQLSHYTSLKASDLETVYQYKEGVMSLREWLEKTEKEENMKVLNFLPEDEAFDLYRKHSERRFYL